MVLSKYWNKTMRNISIICLGLLIFFAGYYFIQKKIDGQIQTKDVLVANGNIEPFGAVTPENTHLIKKPISEITPDSVSSYEELKANNSFATQYGFIDGSNIRTELVTTAAASKLGTAVGLEKGKLEMAIKTDLITSNGAEIKAGNRVDIFAFIGNNNGAGRSVEDPTLKNIKVMKVKNTEGLEPTTEGGNTTIPAAIVVEVTSAQAQKIIQYQGQGTVYPLLSGFDQ